MSALALLAASALAGAAPADCGSVAFPARPDVSRVAQDRRVLYAPLVRAIACENNVHPLLLDALVLQESRYNPVAVSHAGAIGLGQLMPGTARMLGVNPHDVRENLTGAARYLRSQLDTFGSVRLALAAYNAGPGRVLERMSVPRIAETQNYVSVVERDFLRAVGQSPARPDASVILVRDGVEVEQGEAGLETAASEPPPQWDVFARFRWEQSQRVEGVYYVQ